MAVDAIIASCEWCGEEKIFRGDDPENQWVNSDWLVYLCDGEDSQEFCSVECLTSKLS